MDGDLDEIIDALQMEEQARKLKELNDDKKRTPKGIRFFSASRRMACKTIADFLS